MTWLRLVSSGIIMSYGTDFTVCDSESLYCTHLNPANPVLWVHETLEKRCLNISLCVFIILRENSSPYQSQQLILPALSTIA